MTGLKPGHYISWPAEAGRYTLLHGINMATRRLYYDDCYQREFGAQVLTWEPEARAATRAWTVVLDCTALYPTSGGQPHDLGKLGDANVLDVRDDDDDIVHVVDRELPLGSVQGCVDWARRFDHMQQHTGQHLLSAMFQERFGRPTVSFHLGSDLCTIDLRGPQPTDEILEGAEELKCAPEDWPASSQRAVSERDSHFKTVRTLLQRLAEEDAAVVLQSAKTDANGIRVVARVFGEESQPEYVNSLATQLAKAEKTVALLARYGCGHLIFAQHPAAGKDMNALLKQVLAQFAGKGGGTRDFARGKLTDASQADAAVSLAARLLSAG